MGYMKEHTYETAPPFSSSATPVVGYKADNSDGRKADGSDTNS